METFKTIVTGPAKALMVLAVLALINCSGTLPPHVAEGHGKLAPCPETPNCVFTDAPDEDHKIAPFTYTTDTKTAIHTLVSAVMAMKHAEIISQLDNYLYVTFTSGFWRFVDDVEFSFDEENKIIHFRSASRLGKKDFGKNRKRLESIRTLFNERIKPADNQTTE